MSTDGERYTRRAALVGAACVATGGTALAVTPRRHEETIGKTRVADIMPERAGPWFAAPAANMVLPESNQSSSFYDQVFTRTYQAADAPPVMLLVAYGAAQSGLMKVHRPEVCYASAGFSIRKLSHVPLSLGLRQPVDATTFTGWREDRVEQVLYWTRISDVFPRNMLQQRLVLLERGLAGVIPDGVLVRCSIAGPNAAASVGALRSFAQALVVGASPEARALLVGTKVPTSLAAAGVRGPIPPALA